MKTIPKKIKRGLVILLIIFFGLLFTVLSHLKVFPNFTEILQSIGVELLAGLLLYFLLTILLEKWLGKSGNSLKLEIPEEINELIEEIEPNKKIRILTTMFSFIEEETEKHEFKEALKKAITHKKANIKILIVDPISHAIIQRQANMKKIPKYKNVYPTITNTIHTLKELNNIYNLIDKKNKDKFQVKVFNELPPFLLYQIGKSLNMIFYANNKIAAEDRFWRFNETSEFADFVTDNFDRIWNSTSTCTLENYLVINLIDIEMNLYFIDIFNIETGIFFENRVLAYSISKEEPNNIPNNGKVKYRGNEVPYRKVEQLKLEQNQNSNKLVNDIDSIDLDVSITNLHSYLIELWKQKYRCADDGSKYDVKIPSSFAFIQILEKNIS